MGTKDTERPLGLVFSLSVPKLSIFACSLPALGMVISVVLSLIYNFESSTATHCRVPNYLPSISAAIGGFTPQRYIWRICIALHCAPRFMFAIAYYNHYMSFDTKDSALYKKLCLVLAALHLIENYCLVSLTMISSTENFDIHEISFIVFLLTSQFYMVITLVLHKWSRSTKVGMSTTDKRSFNIKLFLWVANLASIAFAMYFYYRHNEYCEPGVYSFFALCEYMVVLSNVFFHGSAISRDFKTFNVKIEGNNFHRKGSDSNLYELPF